ncbi:DUF4230 domain-containing protein [Myroides marinus]|uniref:DUF4230 domain-containing protein n=1 Tax=Myroides marinus TaxID=703342 RepID=A0A161SBM1_9FLAO|nr:DUF4230 domain-containing protein [Myroides marinus]KUF45528.1 hypothetical protein AS361_07810 [Myroides marinus]KZE83370.1 hypothetical protein AV926_00165 [Myroides marinus]MDM1367837.1 DUF4230 domain-containing protein [Myroides marinus]MDM1373624.1 DUF4230 domain-containing protein [Myroides marinus]MDM1376215.1 DUF4230 domain-containing protein [Myroides marinus]
MRKLLRVLFGIFVVLFFMFSGVVVYNYLTKGKSDDMQYNTALIQEQLKNVSKLVVTEATFSQVMTYKDQQKYLMNLLSFDKKAVVIINAKATVGYDLSQLKYQIDEKNKVVQILFIPEAEVNIYPDYKILDVEQSKFNPFKGEDYNKINAKVKKDLEDKIEKSTLKSNAENRLISELSKILIVTQALGWKLEYQGNTIQSDKDLVLDMAL